MKLFSKMALRNLLRNKRRSFSTGAAVMAGFVGLCLLGGYILRTERFLRVTSVYVNHSGHLSIYKKGGLEFYNNNPRRYHLSGQDIQTLRSILASDPEVEFTAPVLQGIGLLSNGQKSVPFMGYGINPADEKRIQQHPQVTEWTSELVPASKALSIKDAEGPLADTISITKELGSLVGRQAPFQELNPEQKDVQLAGRTFEGDLNAVNANLGFKHTTGYAMMEDTGLVAPLKVMQDLYVTEGGTYLAVYLKPQASTSDALARLEEKIKTAGLNYEVFPFDDDRISLFYVGTMGFLYIMAGFFVFLIFSAVALSIVNSMTIGIMERVREIGTLRALGFTNAQTAWLFTLESVYLTLLSLIVGFFATKLIAGLVNSLNIRFEPPGISGDMQFVLTPDAWFCASLAVPILIISLICAFVVSRKLVDKPIIHLLQQAN